MEHKTFLKQAVEQAFKGMRAGKGGPFGAVVVRNGQVIGEGHNTVLESHDPTAHAEVNAIRNACKKVKDYHLTGAVIYTNFEPCPMCLAAIYWADIRHIFYSAGRETARQIGFMDGFLYEEISRPMVEREMDYSRIKLTEMTLLVDEWMNMKGKILY